MKYCMRYLLFVVLVIVVQTRWSVEEANNWYNSYLWSAGVNYIPAYAVNEIEMWESLDLNAISEELRWATALGFSKFRVFLHIEPYLKNADQFLLNIFKFLTVAKMRGAGIIFVLFDDCWNDHYTPGVQPDPIPGIHNSRWLQCPGNNPVTEEQMKNYVIDVIAANRNRETVVMWDLYNEVGNSGKLLASLPLAKKVFEWSRSANPTQPLTSGHWNNDIAFDLINEFILSESDIITFHAYCDVTCTHNAITQMQKHNRPVICTQYMARDTGSKFITHLPLFKQQNVWAISWGFVFGRTQTYYPWWSKLNDPVPAIWFHDVVHPNGTVFDEKEAEAIKNATRLQL